MAEVEHDNIAILRELEQTREKLQFECCWRGLQTIFGFPFFSLGALRSLSEFSKSLGELQNISQRVLLMRQLVEAFESDGITIYPDLPFEPFSCVSFFLKFPSKELFLIQIRAIGKSRVQYNEGKQVLQFLEQRGGLRTWKPDPLLALQEQERWLRANRSDLLGTSAAAKRRPMAKVLLLWGDTVLRQPMKPKVGATTPNSKYLLIRRTGMFYVVENDHIIDFIRTDLNSKRRDQAL